MRNIISLYISDSKRIQEYVDQLDGNNSEVVASVDDDLDADPTWLPQQETIDIGVVDEEEE